MTVRTAILLVPLAASGAADAGLLLAAASRDATIYSESGAIANGAGQFLFAGRTNSGAIRRGLLMFDLSSIPTGAVVVSATLRIHLEQAATGTATVSLHRSLASWTSGASDPSGNEGSGTAAGLGDVTWLARSVAPVSPPWESPGGDFTADAAASASVGTELGWQALEFTSLAGLQAMVADPGVNHGWFLMGDESVNQTTRRFTSADGISEFRPVLEVNWTVVPAPGAALAFAIAGLRRSRRRR